MEHNDLYIGVMICSVQDFTASNGRSDADKDVPFVYHGVLLELVNGSIVASDSGSVC